jgi:hypothetical protein
MYWAAFWEIFTPPHLVTLDEVDIFSCFVDILTVGNLEVGIGTCRVPTGATAASEEVVVTSFLSDFLFCCYFWQTNLRVVRRNF